MSSQQDPGLSPEHPPADPFGRGYGRYLIPWIIVAFSVVVFPLEGVWSGWLEADEVQPLPDALYGFLATLLLGAGAALLARLRRVDAERLWGKALPARQWLSHCAHGIPLVAVAIVATYVVYVPLSYPFPEFVREWVLGAEDPLLYRDAPHAALANVLLFITLVILAPVVEESLFRGLLYTRWSRAWGPRPAILVSSLLFGVLHVDLLGGAIFGVVMALLYCRTGSLWAPVAAHGANNLLAWSLGWYAEEGGALEGLLELEGWRAAWWLPALSAGIVAPWAWRFFRRGPRLGEATPPYLRGRGGLVPAPVDALIDLIESERFQEALELLEAKPELALGTSNRDGRLAGATALHWAAGRGALVLCERLLAHGADPNSARARWWRTPLAWAADGGRAEVVDLLLAHGADVNADAYGGTSALHAAAQGGSSRGARDPSGYARVTTRLLEHGVDAERRAAGDRGQTALEDAVRSGNEAVAQILRHP